MVTPSHDDRSDRPDRASTETNSASVTYNWQDYSYPSTAIIETVAAITGENVTDLPPFHDTIDVDSFDNLLMTPAASGGDDLAISLTYAGVEVIVRQGGLLEVFPETPYWSD